MMIGFSFKYFFERKSVFVIIHFKKKFCFQCKGALFGIILQLISQLDDIISNSLHERAEESSSFELILIQNILKFELVHIGSWKLVHKTLFDKFKTTFDK